MVCHLDAPLDELLADPIVALVMRRDGVSPIEARGLYETVGRQLNEARRRARRRALAAPEIEGPAPG